MNPTVVLEISNGTVHVASSNTDVIDVIVLIKDPVVPEHECIDVDGTAYPYELQASLQPEYVEDVRKKLDAYYRR